MPEAILYIVATPIGNLADMTPRAIEVLNQVDIIAAEDTRHSARLMQHFAITTPMVAYHDHSDDRRLESLMQHLHEGHRLALISDAGTPLISDPGYKLVKLAREAAIKIVPIPGASAMMAALSVAGLPTDRFIFEGFLPAKQQARCNSLQKLVDETHTMIFYEAPHRIAQCLSDMVEIFGPLRAAVLARELTKTFETVKGASLNEIHQWVLGDSNQQRGEIVLLVAGSPSTPSLLDAQALRVVKILAQELAPKQAAALAAKITGVKKKLLYDALIELRG